MTRQAMRGEVNRGEMASPEPEGGGGGEEEG